MHPISPANPSNTAHTPPIAIPVLAPLLRDGSLDDGVVGMGVEVDVIRG